MCGSVLKKALSGNWFITCLDKKDGCIDIRNLSALNKTLTNGARDLQLRESPCENMSWWESLGKMKGDGVRGM